MIVFAVSCHPDDLEFQMAGTLLLLKKAGCEIHYLNIANGSLGSAETGIEETVAQRRRESMRSSQILGAVYHESLANDMEVLHSPELIRRLTALVRQVKPDVVLALSLEDYMEDHMNSARLAVTASFLRGVPNYHSFPPEPPVFKDVMVYHSTPHTLTDQIRRPIIPELFVDISAMIEEKERMLSCHESQREWLDKSQGFGSYLATMRQIGEKLGLLSGRFLYAEGWRRHCHVGFSRVDANPLAELLADFCHMPTSG